MALLLGLGPAATAASSKPEGYIVVFNDWVDAPGAAARQIAGQVGGQVGFIYQHALKGFSITVPAQAVAVLEGNPMIKYVATDDVRHIFAQDIPTGIQRIFADGNPAMEIDGGDDYRVNVDVAVIDTGVDFQHPDLNVAGGVDCSGGSPLRGACVSGGNDDHGHGTHVAGTIGAIDNGVGVVGVAPGARLWAVKVLKSNGNGYTSWIVAGIDWIAKNVATIDVANMSLGGSGYNQAEYDAIQGAVNKGVAFAVAAGNNNADANNYSPAAFDNVLSVSALADFDGFPDGYGDPTCRSDQDDTLADFSNWGTAIDIAAPGVCIRSTYPVEKGEYAIASGTSLASPHVAGALALLASVNKPKNAADVHNLYNTVKTTGNFNWTDDSGDGIKEPLLDVSNAIIFKPALIAGSSDDTLANTPPSVSITSPADGATFSSKASIAFQGTASDEEDGNLSTNLAWTSNKDGTIGTGNSFFKILSDATHIITATASDSSGAKDSDSIIITVGGDTGSGFTLGVANYKVKGTKYADLTWSGAISTNVDIYRDGKVIVTTVNDLAYTDGPLGKGGGSATYQVCEENTTTCSTAVTASW
jgi:subtilisin family serine protease